MLKAELPFLTEQLVVATPDQLTDIAWETLIGNLIDLIDNAEAKLSTAGVRNHITRINDADLGLDIVIDPELAAYIDVCMKSYLLSNGIVKCFELDGHHSQLAEFFSLVVTDTEAVVIKHQELVFNPRLLLPYYIFDQLDSALQSANIKNYILSIHNLKLARGDDSWEIEFDHPLYDPENSKESNLIEMMMRNQVLFLEPAFFHAPDEYAEARLANPFLHIPQKPQIAGVIVECENACTAKVLGQIAATKNYNFEFQVLAQEWEAGIVVIDLEGEVSTYRKL